MDVADRVDDRTFGVNFSSEGVAMLREGVNEKLKDFLGDYTDNILVEYVIVLLKNGRRKEEAKNELNVFLGDDSDCFVSWLWDHLGSNLHLYVQPHESHPDEAAKTKPRTRVQAGGNNSCRLDSDSERGKSNKLSGSRHNRDWKCLVRDADKPLPFQSFVVDNADADGKTQHTIIPSKRSPSPQPRGQKKRSWPDEPKLTKRRVASQATTGAPRRLLQFAVRDALATSRSSSSISEPALKRLRSVVSTTAGDSSVEGRHRRLDSVPRVSNAMITAIKAVEEAAKVVVKNRSTDNVFDRLGRGMDVPEVNDQLAEFGEAAHKGMEYGELDEGLGEARSSYLRRSDYTGEYGGDMTTLETDTGMDSDSAVDTGRFTGANVTGGVMDISQTGSSGGNESQDPLMVRPSVAKNSDEIMRKPWKNQDLPASVDSASRKIVNISVNVNTWKPPHYQEPTEVSEMDSLKSVLESEAGPGKSALLLMKDDSNPVSVSSGNRNGNATPAAAGQRDSQKLLPATPSLYSTGRPTEDADSRTIFVTNVHFAATKDSLSRHFNKFGEVLKVIIVTDAATGQPRGSAYVEFLRKDAAENALSLDGTSFMSRILKVVKKSSAQEAAPVMSWPHVVHGSMFAPPRFARVPFSKGFPSVYRARPPIMPGARSLQWKRDAQVAPSDSGASSGNSVSSPAVRSLTYVRTEPKTNGGSGIA